jgi:hypothetical protein
METILGFVAGYLVGTREGKDGLERMRSSLRSISASPEVRKLATEAVTMAEMMVRRTTGGGGLSLGGAVGNVTDMLVKRAVAAREGSRAA